MIHKATELIARCFDEHYVKYRVTEVNDASLVEAAFNVPAGPEVIVRYISNSEENDVAVRVFGLVHRIPPEKRAAVMEACNLLCGKIRFFKFYLTADADVNVEADLPIRTDDDCLGECCFEYFVRLMNILENEYHLIAEAIYRTPQAAGEDSGKVLRLLRELRDKPVVLTGDNDWPRTSPTTPWGIFPQRGTNI